MPPVLEHACPHSGHHHDDRAIVCEVCGSAPRAGELVEHRARREPWLYLGIGLVLAALLACVPLVRYLAGFLATLLHEMGHAGLAWLCASAAAPGLAAGGHPALHGEPWLPLGLGIFVMLVASAAAFLEGRRRVLAIALIAAGYPALVLTQARDLVHLFAGQGAELVAATLCLWMALHGRWTESRAERALHGAIGWLLLGRNTAACWALVRARSRLASGPGEPSALADDCRHASELLGWTPPAVALAMLLGALLVVPGALCLWRLTRGAQGALPG